MAWLEQLLPKPRALRRGREPVSEYALFLRGLIDRPRDVSAPTPSGPVLAAAIAAEVDPEQAGLVVEFGPGTGTVTQALLDRGVLRRNLVVIESSEYFCALLRERFEGINIQLGDAT